MLQRSVLLVILYAALDLRLVPLSARPLDVAPGITVGVDDLASVSTHRLRRKEVSCC